MKSIVTLILILPFLASAQPRIGIYSGVNFPSVSSFFVEHGQNEELGDYWYPAINLGVDLEIPLMDWLEISPLFEYNHYLFDQYYPITVGPPPFLKQSSGQVSRIYRLMLEARLVDQSAGGDRLYLVTGLGYIVENIGHVTLTWGDDNTPDYTSEVIIQGKSYWAHSMGVGYQIVLSQSLGIDICAKYYSNYTDRFDVSANLGIAYTLAH